MGQGSLHYWSRTTERTACFPGRLFVAFGMRGPQRAMRANLVQWVFHRATELLASDDRFSKRANRFHEKYAIVQSRVMD